MTIADVVRIVVSVLVVVLGISKVFIHFCFKEFLDCTTWKILHSILDAVGVCQVEFTV